MISEEADSVLHDAILAEQCELRSFRQSGTSGCVGHEADSPWSFRAIQHFLLCGCCVLAVGVQFTTDLWFAQGKLEQAGDSIDAPAARPRHAVKCVRHVTHTAIESPPCVFIPCITMSAAY